MFTTTANSSRIWAILFGVLALLSGYELASATQSVLLPALGFVGFGTFAAASFLTYKRMSAAPQSGSKASTLEVGLQVGGIVAILARMYFRYLA
jgi:hypothetical protein